jgi:hypothetical protein
MNSSNSNFIHVRPTSDTIQLARGEAALVLIESVLLTLIESRVLTKDQVQEAVDLAIGTQRQAAEEEHHPDIANAGAGLLAQVGNSLAAAGHLDV